MPKMTTELTSETTGRLVTAVAMRPQTPRATAWGSLAWLGS